jgi:hypothetical protein
MADYMTDNEPLNFFEMWQASREALGMLAAAGEMFHQADAIQDLRQSLQIKYEAMILQREAIRMLKAADLIFSSQLETTRTKMEEEMEELRKFKA